ncbi:MAG: endonuclease domain-containing protein [Patescibacteria group bacterium]
MKPNSTSPNKGSLQSPLLREERVRVRRKLRVNSTPAEQIIWHKIRSRQLNNLKFRRQHHFGKYIADFYCPEKKLVIEIDGDVHDLECQREHDKKRGHYLTSLGLRVLHITNDEVRNNLTGVLESILLQPHPSPQPSPLKRGRE